MTLEGRERLENLAHKEYQSNGFPGFSHKLPTEHQKKIIQNIFSDHDEIKVEVNNRKTSGKTSKTYKLKNVLGK